jgi:hypothetical protein
MATAKEWAERFAEQADADFRAWELYERNPHAVAAPCHKAQFLQMACEKLCKAHQLRTGAAAEWLLSTHKVIAKTLSRIIQEEMERRGQKRSAIRECTRFVKKLAQEIEFLSPSLDDGGKRPDNCEYPWEQGGIVYSPLRRSFIALQLLTEPSGITFLKSLRNAINRNQPKPVADP